MLDQTNETLCYSSSSEPTPAASQVPKSLAPCAKAAGMLTSLTIDNGKVARNGAWPCALAHLSTNFRNRDPKAENKCARARQEREGMRISAGALASDKDHARDLTAPSQGKVLRQSR